MYFRTRGYEDLGEKVLARSWDEEEEDRMFRKALAGPPTRLSRLVSLKSTVRMLQAIQTFLPSKHSPLQSPDKNLDLLRRLIQKSHLSSKPEALQGADDTELQPPAGVFAGMSSREMTSSESGKEDNIQTKRNKSGIQSNSAGFEKQADGLGPDDTEVKGHKAIDRVPSRGRLTSADTRKAEVKNHLVQQLKLRRDESRDKIVLKDEEDDNNSGIHSAGRFRKAGHLVRWVNRIQDKERPPARPVLIRFEREGEAKALFRKCARKVFNVLKWMKILNNVEMAASGEEVKTFLDLARSLDHTATHQRIEESSGLFFDLGEFRARKELRLTQEVRDYLTLPSSARDPEMVQKITFALAYLKSFAEYPIHMQQKFAKVAWYQEVPQHRMILRQGHPGYNFYFILGGTVDVKVISHNTGSGAGMRSVARLSKGQSFGEVALIHHVVRTATVESASDMQLLVIGREDFRDIFLNCEDGREPEHINFLRNHVMLLKNWPIDELLKSSGECLFHYFRPGSVIVPDSRQNEWIYIIKSGTCRVMKKLLTVKAESTWTGRKSLDTEVLSRLNVREADPKIDSWWQSPTDEILRDSHSTLHVHVPPIKPSIRLPERSSSAGTQCSKSSNIVRTPDDSSPGTRDLPPKRPRSEPSYSVPGRSKPRLGMFPQLAKPRVMEPNPFTDDKPRKVRFEKPKSPTKPAAPCFVELQKLRSKGTFGLEDVVFDDEKYVMDVPETSVTLISNGAEVVMLSKKIFIKHANEKVRNYLRHHIRPFPSDDTLQANLQTEVNWAQFCGQTVKHCMTSQTSKRTSNSTPRSLKEETFSF